MIDDGERGEFRISDSKAYVKIRYEVRVEGGPLLKGVDGPEEMDFLTGYRQVIPGLERRLIGHVAGDKLSFTVPPEEAFGIRHEELVIEKKRSEFHFPGGFEPYPGMQLPLISSAQGAPDTVTVREIREDTIVIDCNHPLSGAALRYDLEIIEARPATEKDTCSEWEETSQSEPCGCAPHEIVLGSTAGENPSEA